MLTVGDLKKALQDYPDTAKVYVGIHADPEDEYSEILCAPAVGTEEIVELDRTLSVVILEQSDNLEVEEVETVATSTD